MDVRYCGKCLAKMPFVAGLCAKCRGRESAPPAEVATGDSNAPEEERDTPRGKNEPPIQPTPKPAKNKSSHDEATADEVIKGLVTLGCLFILIVGLWKCGTNDKPRDATITAPETPEQRAERNLDKAVITIEHLIRRRLKDPRSYDRDAVMPIISIENGVIGIVITFRAKNSFGGYTEGFASGNCNLDGEDCKLLRMQ